MKKLAFILSIIAVTTLSLSSCDNSSNSDEESKIYEDGYEDGYSVGYDKGFEDAVDISYDDLSSEISWVEERNSFLLEQLFDFSYSGLILQDDQVWELGDCCVTFKGINDDVLNYEIYLKNENISKFVTSDEYDFPCLKKISR